MAEHAKVSSSQKANAAPESSQLNNTHVMQGSHPSAIIQRARMNPQSLSHADIMQLQSTIGNKAVMQLFKDIGFEKPAQKDEPVQKVAKPEAYKRVSPEPVQKKENKTGLPDNLKAGVESMSGMDMGNVRVHYNSDKPAQVGALAYTQGSDIHVAPGQEKHLPHEAWHVVQQAQGRVRPTMQMKGVQVNDDAGLEREADVMGGKAASHDNGMERQGHRPAPLGSVNKQTGSPVQYQTLYRGMKAASAAENKPLLADTTAGLGVREDDVTVQDGNVTAGGMSTAKATDSVPGFTISSKYPGGADAKTDTAKDNFRWKWSLDDGDLPNTLTTQNDHGDHVLIKPVNNITLADFRTAVKGTQAKWAKIAPP